MRYLALACDYDGTIASGGRVGPRAVAALDRVRDTGRRLVLVTGRSLDDLRRVFPELDRFDRVVAENGGVLYAPDARRESPLAEPPPAALAAALAARGVEPLQVARVLVATREPHHTTLVEVLRELGLEYQVVFNKGAVMALPSGVNKATGLAAALGELGLSPHNAVGIGDAENDHAFLQACECAVAVADALPAVRDRADLVTAGGAGDGFVELVERLVDTDLADLEPALTRHHVLLGTRDDGTEARLPPYGSSLLVAGPSGSGKSTLTTGVLERLADAGYQFCLVDPEGDYTDFPVTVPLGDVNRAPDVEEVVRFLADASARPATVSLVGLPLADRPAYFERLLPRLVELRVATGRPHWVAVDEAHHLMPAETDTVPTYLPRDLGGVLLVTVHPDRVATAALAPVDHVVAVGAGPEEPLRAVAAAQGRPGPPVPEPADDGTVVLWRPGGDPVRLRVLPPRSALHRHRRKYAEGDLGDRGFFFRGPHDRLNLRARNLQQFLELADGVDDETWAHHLARGDVARWFAEGIKDDDLAAAAERIATRSGTDAAESRALIRAAVEERYTLPA